MTTEKLHFKLELAGTYWDKKPAFSVLFNNQVINDKQIMWTESDESFYIEFDAEAKEDTKCCLTVRLENKEWTDTLQNEDKTEILKDMLLHIRSVEIDEIDLGFNLILTKSQFVGDDPERPVLDKCVDLGWNGSWNLEFDSPFYIWLLENI